MERFKKNDLTQSKISDTTDGGPHFHIPLSNPIGLLAMCSKISVPIRPPKAGLRSGDILIKVMILI